MENNRELEEMKEHNKYLFENEIKPLTLSIDKNIWGEFKSKVSRKVTLNDAILYLISKFVFIEKGELKDNLIINELFNKITRSENNCKIIYGEDWKGNKIKKQGGKK